MKQKGTYPFFSSTETNSCPLGWHTLGESCFQLNINPLKSQSDSRRECHKRGGRLAVFESSLTTQDLTAFLEDYMEYLGWFHIDALPVAHFVTTEQKQFSLTSSLWGPGEPSWDGWCGNMILGQKGWRVNDESCYVNIGFVCQTKTNTSGKETNIIYNS